jgi:1-acyl-sn-glycerol-3-phosphate acyltransferase
MKFERITMASRTDQTFYTEETTFRRMTMWFVYSVLRAAGSFEVVTPENLPESGAVILAPNHIANWDSVAVLSSLRQRPIYIMAKEELFKNKIMSFLLRHWGAYPVDRTGDAYWALRHSKTLIEGGKVLGIFPEGTRSLKGLIPGKAGMARMAIQFGLRVVPVAIEGTPYLFKRVFPRPRVRITVCPPIQADRSMTADELTERVMRTIADQLPLEMRGVYS